MEQEGTFDPDSKLWQCANKCNQAVQEQSNRDLKEPCAELHGRRLEPPQLHI